MWSKVYKKISIFLLMMDIAPSWALGWLAHFALDDNDPWRHDFPGAVEWIQNQTRFCRLFDTTVWVVFFFYFAYYFAHNPVLMWLNLIGVASTLIQHLLNLE